MRQSPPVHVQIFYVVPVMGADFYEPTHPGTAPHPSYPTVPYASFAATAPGAVAPPGLVHSSSSIGSLLGVGATGAVDDRILFDSFLTPTSPSPAVAPSAPTSSGSLHERLPAPPSSSPSAASPFSFGPAAEQPAIMPPAPPLFALPPPASIPSAMPEEHTATLCGPARVPTLFTAEGASPAPTPPETARPPAGIGEGAIVRRAIIDKNARVGQGARIIGLFRCSVF